MRVAFLGTSYFIIKCIKGFIEAGIDPVLVITLDDAKLPDNSYDVGGYCKRNKISCLKVKDINSKSAENTLKKLNLDILFVSWPKILKKNILQIPKIGCVGTHPTSLPFNRGRHPIQWQIFLGIKKTALSFIWLDEGIDTGEIVLKMEYLIHEEDSIVDVNKKINELGYEGCKLLALQLKPPKFRSKNSIGNDWRKRDLHDCIIDARMSADSIVRLVQSFTKPYPCAKIITKENIINIISAKIVDHEGSIPRIYIEPGKIISVSKNKFLMKSYDFIIELESDVDLSSLLGNEIYIYPPTKYINKKIF